MSKAGELDKKLLEILDEIKHRNDEAELKEDKISQVGIFYVIKEDVLIDSLPVIEVPTKRGTKIFDKLHKDWWGEIQVGLLSLKPLTASKGYNYYQRGRVTYIESDDKYIIFQDSCISNKMTKEIAGFFNLPDGKYEVRTDRHYKCYRCRKG